MYLKIMTWHEAQIVKDGIYGTLADLERLATLIDRHLETATADSTFRIGMDYAQGANAVMVFEVRAPGLDPATADPLLTV
jgi:hypothetical protein